MPAAPPCCAYGNTRELVLGLEVVLADGRIWNGLGKLRKDNTGYDLHLFIGSEGTLGIITAAVLKLFPKPRAVVTTFCGVPSPAAALDLLARAKAKAGSAVTTFELMPRFGIDTVVIHMGCRDPLASVHPWYVLMEWSSPSDTGLEDACEAVLGDAIEAEIVLDATLATSLDQRNGLWRIREALSEAQGFEGGSIKHDISLPLARVPEFIDEVNAALRELVPGCRRFRSGTSGTAICTSTSRSRSGRTRPPSWRAGAR